ncbi:uncharacterized protein LOC143284459 isoform X2 [Babylonia areolata]
MMNRGGRGRGRGWVFPRPEAFPPDFQGQYWEGPERYNMYQFGGPPHGRREFYPPQHPVQDADCRQPRGYDVPYRPGPPHRERNVYPPPNPFHGTAQNWQSYRNDYDVSFQSMPERPFYENPGYNGALHPQAPWTSQNQVPYSPATTPNSRDDDANSLNLSSHPPTNEERYRLFANMLRCGEKTYGKTYLAIYWLQFSDRDTPLSSPLFENNSNGHAEDYLLEHLQLQLDVVNQERLQSVFIMQNASPCWKCAENYMTLRDQMKGNDVKIVLVFSAFHWLRRLSCRHDGHRHKFISKERHEENREGLRNLCKSSFLVRTTEFHDWRRLCTALQIPFPPAMQCEESYHGSPRGQEDDRLKGDLEEILC